MCKCKKTGETIKWIQTWSMRTPLYAMLILLASACMPKQPQSGNEQELCMLVGTYTGGSSKGIYTFRFNQETGECHVLSSFELPNPSYLTTSTDGQFVYAVSEMEDTSAAVSALALDKKSGKLQLLNRERTWGAAPCYVTTNGKCVLTANYSGGTMSVFPLLSNGKVEPVDSLFEGMANGPDPVRQNTPHLHCACFSPDGKYIFVTDFSADRILRYVVHPEDAIPYASAEITEVEAGSGPRHLTFHPKGDKAYLINELSGKIVAFNYTDGQLTPIQTITADTLAARGSADIHVSPDGKYLYASNRLKGDGIAIFAINPDDGTLAKAGYQPTGRHPRNFNITPNGKFLLVACRDSHCIQIYQRNETSGLLTRMQPDIAIDQPVCIQFVR